MMNMYSSRVDEEAPVNSVLIEKCPATGRDIEYTMVEVPSDSFKKFCKKSKYNQRSVEHLNEQSTGYFRNDLLTQKYNSEAAKAYGTSTNMTVMVGYSRGYTLSAIPDGIYRVWLTTEVTPEEEQQICGDGDNNKPPTTADLALCLKNLEQNGEQFTVRQVVSTFKASHGKAQNAKSLMNLPEYYFNLFIKIDDVPINESIELSKLIKGKTEKQVKTILSKLPSVKDVKVDEEKSVADHSKKLISAIKELVAKLKEPSSSVTEKVQPELPSYVNVKKLTKGVKVVPGDKSMKITVPNDLDETKLKAIINFLSEK